MWTDADVRTTAALLLRVVLAILGSDPRYSKINSAILRACQLLADEGSRGSR